MHIPIDIEGNIFYHPPISRGVIEPAEKALDL
jgi:hypothetical protein